MSGRFGRRWRATERAGGGRDRRRGNTEQDFRLNDQRTDGIERFRSTDCARQFVVERAPAIRSRAVAVRLRRVVSVVVFGRFGNDRGKEICTMNNTNSSSFPSPSWQVTVMMYLNTKVFAVQFLLGFGGNCLNLMVLLNKKMRSRTNLLFAAMAFADLAFLVVFLPQYFFIAQILIRFPDLLITYYSVNNHLTALANWFSATSIWLIVAVTIERVTVVRSPFQASIRDLSWKFALTIVGIFAAAFAMTFFHHFSWRSVQDADGVWRQKAINEHIVEPIVILNAVAVFALPCVVLVVLNVLLIRALKQQTFPSDVKDGGTGDRMSQHSTSRSRNEKKVTYMVVVIVSSFIVCNAPSAIMFIMRLAYAEMKKSMTFALLNSITNTLVVTGKVLNFILFCTSSKHFRKLLIDRIKHCCPLLFRHRRRASSQSTRLTNGAGGGVITPGGMNLTPSVTTCRDRHRDSASSFLEERTPLCNRSELIFTSMGDVISVAFRKKLFSTTLLNGRRRGSS
uniref:G-protein coupled receptors family 1 profile domain-containing protein n=1 Tax=Plectus sambesii TaxID=2011161 RepID=A0A914VMJ9_9BILA